MIIAEAFHTCLTSHRSLLFTHFRQTKIIEAQICWYTWLGMSTKQRLGTCHISPLRKSRSPPMIILWYGMKLGKI